jgi:hypothetical protein
LPVLEEKIRNRDHREDRHHRTHQVHRQTDDHPQQRRGIKPQHRLQAMPLRPQDRRHDAAKRQQLEQALGEIGERLLAEDALGAFQGRNLGELGLERFARPDQAVLQQVACDRRDHQQQDRHAERGKHHIFQVLHQPQEIRTIDVDHPGIGDEVAQRHLDAADGTGKVRENKGCGRNHEPGVDLLALGDVAALMRIVEAFLRGVFCAFAAIVLVGHRYTAFT